MRDARPWSELRLQLSKPIAVATQNLHKFSELQVLWGETQPRLIMAGKEYPQVDEPFDMYEENAKLKARELSRMYAGPTLADDSGIEVKVLGWKPGVRSSRTPSAQSTPEERNAYLLERLKATGGSERNARFVCVCVLTVRGFEPVVARGEVEGLITDEARGTAGFGYDPIFYYPPYGCTFAEAGEEAKHAVSHRGRAVRALRAKIAPLIEH